MTTNPGLLLIALIWAIGACIYAYRQARFYQIEEYKTNRYWRWILSRRDRWFLRRPILAAFLGALFGVFFSEGGMILPTIIAIIASSIGVIPPAEGEIKKRFNRTPRATRLLGATFTVIGVISVIGLLMLNPIANDLPEAGLIGVIGIGLALYLTVPIALALGNLLMTPVETFFRQRFIAKARRVLREVNPRVIGITGSYGKTTTKNFIVDILNGRYHAYATPKSYNTMMGVCIAINNDLANNYAIDYFVVEMGAYFQGEIGRISNLTPPDISIVVEVGPQHLERFGSLENTAKAKYEIIKALKPDGVGIFNWDNPYVREMYEQGYPNTRITVSKTAALDLPNPPDLIATEIHETLDGLTFTVTDTRTGHREGFQTTVIGEHNVTNILLATAVALHENMSLKEIAARARFLKPSESRLVRQTTPEGITIINDAYSANPAGIVSALKVLAMHQTGKRLLITPGMVELADLHERENRRLGVLAAQYATDVILVGKTQTEPIYAGLQEAAFPSDRLQVVDSLSEAVVWYREHLRPGDTVLFLNDLPDTY